MKLPDLGATSPPALVPDLGPGQGQARDEALDAAAREGMRPTLPDAEPDASEMYAALGRAAQDGMRQALAIERRCSHCGGSSQVPAPVDGDLVPRLAPCPWCSPLKVSER